MKSVVEQRRNQGQLTVGFIDIFNRLVRVVLQKDKSLGRNVRPAPPALWFAERGLFL